MTNQHITMQFPILANHPDLVYLDSAATTLKPQSVIDAEMEYYTHYGANVARGLYPLSEEATSRYEAVREATAQFLHASHAEEIVFTRGTTESLNLLSYSLQSLINQGDEIVVSIAEHHSNFLPWQALAHRSGATFKVAPINDQGFLDTKALQTIITPKTKIFAFNFVSNVTGAINPVQKLVATVKSINPNTLVIVDAAQAAAHLPLDIQTLGCDFLACSSHKMFGPTGVGVLFGKFEHLNAMQPFHYGGEMVLEAKLDAQASIFKAPPHKFEAGTPNIAGVIGFGKALEFVRSVGFETIRKHEVGLLDYAITKLRETFGKDITIYGPQNASHRSGVIAFALEGVHPHDIAQLLGEQGVCIRAGGHCAQPLHQALRTPATARLSISVYTSQEDIDQFVSVLHASIRQIKTA